MSYYGRRYNRVRQDPSKVSVLDIVHRPLLFALHEAMQNAPATFSDKNRKFSADLLQNSKRRTLSDKQIYWVKELTKRALAIPAVVKTSVIGDMAGIKKLFANVASKLKYPKITLSYVPANGVTGYNGPTYNGPAYKYLVIKQAGPNASQPGTLNISSEGGYGSAIWYGRIQDDGTFEQSRNTGIQISEEIIDRLIAFAKDPAKVAAEHGKLTGRCCFCNKHLDDERSTDMGYGPVCAKNYKLPWGKK